MWRWLLRGLTPLLLAGTFLLPAAVHAQGTDNTPPAASASGEAGAEKGHPVPVVAYAAAIVFTAIIMVVVCMPSRKSS